tara:strand:+ start:93 stop:1412 length:1320 start_codon:yes stop_codon:yes gene_type:complete
MAESYANNVDRANEFIRNYRQTAESVAQQAAQNQLEAYYNKLKETRDKYSTEAAEGGEEIAGAAAVHMLYGKVKDMYQKYKNFKEPNTPSEEDDANEQEDDDGSGEQNIDDAGNRPQGATQTEDAPTGDAAPEGAEGAEGMGEGVDTGSGLGGEFTGRSGVADDAIGARLRSRLQFLNNLDGAPPAGAEQVDPNTESIPRSAPEPAAQGGEVEGENPFSFSAFENQRGAFGGEATEESAFGDLSNIPDAGTASGLMNRIDAQQATRVRGGNINRPNGSGAPNNGGQARDLGQGEDGGSQGGLDVNQQAQVGTSSEGSTSADTGISTRGNIQTDPAGGGSALEAGDDALEEGGGGLLGDIGASVGLDAIPVIGEAAAIIQGLVGIGEGIAHLFHPDAPKPKPSVNAEALMTPAAITSKFSAALPSIDGATEDTAGSMSAF